MSYGTEAPPDYNSSRVATGVITIDTPILPQSAEGSHYGTVVFGPIGNAPPSYESLYGELREVRSPTGFGNFVSKTCSICCRSIFAVILIVICSAVPIAMLVIGIKYINDCPVEPLLPIFLIVGGAVLLLQVILDLLYRTKVRWSRGSDNPGRTTKGIQGLLSLFFFCWFIAGNVWVYRIYYPTLDKPSDSRYCNPIVYWLSFSVVTVLYGLFCFFLMLMCWCGCFLFCVSLF